MRFNGMEPTFIHLRRSKARLMWNNSSLKVSGNPLTGVHIHNPLPSLSRNLEHWPGLEFKGFLQELKKAKVTLTLPEEAEWLGYFTAEKAKAQALQAQIAKTDKEIDALVYQLYGLTEEEVRVVEGITST